jgi:sporulation protein YlmC with PRC-barrel domain
METVMNRTVKITTAAALSAFLLAPAAFAPSAFAQGKPQSIALVKIDPSSLATGYRTSKVVGSTVVNEANETVGTIDDLIVTPSEKVPFAVLSVGGFLGIGTKYVVVPYSSLEVGAKNMVLQGATKDSLKSLPDFKYAS